MSKAMTTPTHPFSELQQEGVDAESLSQETEQELRDRFRRRLWDFIWTFALVAACGFAFAMAPTRAHASQIVEIKDSDTTLIRISASDQTRLRAEAGKVLDVIGDVFDAEKNPAGRLVVLRDDDAGEFYLRPLTTGSQPVKIDVKTERGTVGLILTPAAVPGNTITLRVLGGVHRPHSSGDAPRSANHQRAVKAMVLAMASPGGAEGLPRRELPKGGELIELWAEARFVLTAVYEAAGLEGEAYRLTNVSQAPMVLDEREFYRPGVLAVSIRRLQLSPGETTPVWIVRRPDEH